jgi:hypothetical protein
MLLVLRLQIKLEIATNNTQNGLQHIFYGRTDLYIWTMQCGKVIQAEIFTLVMLVEIWFILCINHYTGENLHDVM